MPSILDLGLSGDYSPIDDLSRTLRTISLKDAETPVQFKIAGKNWILIINGLRKQKTADAVASVQANNGPVRNGA
jgi:hypothetical protein